MDCFKLPCMGDRKCRDRLKLLTIFRFDDLARVTGNFSDDNLLGRGSYGSVYKGVLSDGRLVAVKKPTGTSAIPLSNNELEILSKIECSHIVNLLGFCQGTDGVLLVVQFMDRGTLHEALHVSSQCPGWPRRIRFALQIAKAIVALHSSEPQIIHRDIKSSNVLIDARWNALVSDFGLALRGNTQDIMCTPAGTLGYFDPRYDKPEKVGPKIDVFSFGVLLLEIITGRQVIDAQRRPMQMVDWALPLIKQGKALAICDPRLKLPSNSAGIKRMAIVAARCIRLRTSKRPTMEEVVHELSEIRRGRPLTRKHRRSSMTTSFSIATSVEKLTPSQSQSRSPSTSTSHSPSLQRRDTKPAPPPARLPRPVKLAPAAEVLSSFF